MKNPTQHRTRSRVNYYRAVLNRPLKGLDLAADWLDQRCDSMLEVLFALSLLELIPEPFVRRDHIAISEPFSTNPMGAGRSAAFLTCQQEHCGRRYDFGLWSGNDNGANWSEAELLMLVDVDGFNVHRDRRTLDADKANDACVPVLRLPEEAFRDIAHMGISALILSSIWSCECGHVEPRCALCGDILARAVLFRPRRTSTDA